VQPLAILMATRPFVVLATGGRCIAAGSTNANGRDGRASHANEGKHFGDDDPKEACFLDGVTALEVADVALGRSLCRGHRFGLGGRWLRRRRAIWSGDRKKREEYETGEVVENHGLRKIRAGKDRVVFGVVVKT